MSLFHFCIFVLFPMYSSSCSWPLQCRGGQVVEDVLTSGLASKLMRYLRVNVLGEVNGNQKDVCPSTDKSLSLGNSFRTREEGRPRVRQLLETSHADDFRIKEERLHDGQHLERDQDRCASRKPHGEESWQDGKGLLDLDVERADVHDVGIGSEEHWPGQDTCESKFRFGDLDEGGREDSRRRVNRGLLKSKAKGRVTEGMVDNEQALSSPGSGSHVGQLRSLRDRALTKNLDVRKIKDAKKPGGKTSTDGLVINREENDECFQNCRVGNKDISDLVKKAVSAAEAEARSENAPDEAIKAAGDAAAEIVKCAALEVSHNVT